MKNRFKRLDLIDRVTEELWAEINITVQEAVNRTIPRNRNGKKQNGCLKRQLRKEEKQKGKEKWKDIPI